MGPGLFLSLAALFLSSLLVLAQNSPQVKINHFENLPARLYYFDDTTVGSG